MCALASGALAALVLLVAGSVTAQRPGDGQAPRFQVDPWWPKPLPNNWIVGQVSGVAVDRHDHIGRGLIGVEGFKPWVRDEAFRDVPKILETEKGTCPDTGRDWDAINLEVLRGLL